MASFALTSSDIDSFELVHPVGLQTYKARDRVTGNLFSISEDSMGAMVHYRTWIFYIPSLEDEEARQRPHRVCLHWAVVTGIWHLIIDGTKVAADRKSRLEDVTHYYLNSTFFIRFNYLGQSFILNISKVTTAWHYELLLNGLELSEMRNAVEDVAFELHPLEFAIDGDRSFQCEGKMTTWYQVASTHRSTGRRFFVSRRYSDFCVFDEIIRGYTSSHMLSALPPLPGKVLNPFTDQISLEFTERRGKALQQYIIHMLGNSKVAAYAETFCFLGYHPSTYEPLDGAITYCDEALNDNHNNADSSNSNNSNNRNSDNHYNSPYHKHNVSSGGEPVVGGGARPSLLRWNTYTRVSHAD